MEVRCDVCDRDTFTLVHSIWGDEGWMCSRCYELWQRDRDMFELVTVARKVTDG